MRIIGGSHKKKKLIIPKSSNIRPTTDRVKEAIFNAIQFDIEGRIFLDLFAGSGQMGIEALSRGAQKAIFIDNDRLAVTTIRANIQASGLEERSQVFFCDSFAFLKNSAIDFDIAFLDPPYHLGIADQIFPLVSQSINSNGIIICEVAAKDRFSKELNGFFCKKSYRYGQISVDIYRKR
jgi:16S rRNA (guanine(966)-N(2))-methyltransferase RsmD